MPLVADLLMPAQLVGKSNSSPNPTTHRRTGNNLRNWLAHLQARTLAGQPDSGPYRQVGQPPATVARSSSRSTELPAHRRCSVTCSAAHDYSQHWVATNVRTSDQSGPDSDWRQALDSVNARSFSKLSVQPLRCNSRRASVAN